MLDIKEIDITDRDIFRKYYAINKYPNSEYNFTNLFMWKDGYNLKYCLCDSFLIVRGQHESIGRYCTFPVGDGDLKTTVNKVIDYFDKEGLPFNMRPLTKEMRDMLENAMPGSFEFREKRAYFDYVYKVDDLISLSGKKLHSKKNHFNGFSNTYNYMYEKIDQSNVNESKNAVLDFIGFRGGDDAEMGAVSRVFDNYFELGVNGALIRVDGKIVAVTVAENHHGTALIHIEKADTEYRGSYAAINQMFLQNEYSNYKLVNREEDMGIEGLRKAKMSYSPDFLIEKYVVSLK